MPKPPPPPVLVAAEELEQLAAENLQLRERHQQMLRELTALRDMEQRAELRAESDDDAERAMALWILGEHPSRQGRHEAGEAP